MSFNKIYFIGIGGIGMSALARFFLHKGWQVAGYDLTETPLTRQLETEGALVHYTDSESLIPPEFRDPASTMVVFTPAVPSDHRELTWFFDHGFSIEKRSEMLGHLADGYFTMAVAGTHGKTTTTTLLAWLNHCLTGGGNAFLGGISKNFNSNLVLEKTDDRPSSNTKPLLAVEADEFDRSFLRLSPDVALITAVDADHLDIYGTYEAVQEAFTQFTDRIRPGGTLILNKKAQIEIRNSSTTTYTYSLDDSSTDFHVRDNGTTDIITPDGIIHDIKLGIPGRINLENAIGAVAMVWAASKIRHTPLDPNKIRNSLSEFQGVKRRFDFYINTPTAVYMDDYAHHPEELSAALSSLRKMFPDRHITAIFQPHLYTRTRDFASEFAAALSQANQLLITPIYPARELPIEGIGSEMIGEKTTIPWHLVPKEELAKALREMSTDIVVTFGAGNIENHCAEIAAVITQKAKEAHK